jgi:trk system potassium uptake protein TrkA
VYIIIVGAGEVGSYLARILIEEHHDVAVIESNEKLARSLDAALDALVVHGTGVSQKVFLQAGIKKADLVLAVTHVDEVNLIACMTAAKFGSRVRSVARVRQGGDFLALLKADAEVTKAMSEAQIEACFDLGYHMKAVDEIFERVFL